MVENILVNCIDIVSLTKIWTILQFPFLHKANLRIEKILSYPGIDEKSLAQKKINWIASVAVTVMIFCITIAYHIIFPQLRILIYYGLILTLIYSQGIVHPIFFRWKSVWYAFIDQILVVIITFFCILKLGGIPTSGGLIFVGMAQVFFSLNFGKKIHSLLIFIIYVITVILAGILHPYLSVPPEMTTSVNISLFVINLLWISGFAMVFVLNFISQRVKIEQMETNRLKELDNAKTKLYTNITHEFRTPLTLISGMVDLIKNDPERWLDEGCEKIKTNTKILLNLVNQMLNLSKLEAGAMPVNLIRADINLYIKYLVELFQSSATEKKIILSFKNVNQQVVIDYDPDKLMQIISNLLSNALKFTGVDGMVEVATTKTEDGKFKISVKDNGMGIPKNQLPFIFERFYRIEGGSLGSGLGLSLTKELVRLQNGTITAKSTHGKGTVITVLLPITYDAPLEEVPNIHDIKKMFSFQIIPAGNRDTPKQQVLYHQQDKPVLLIVEDNKDVVQLLITFLEKTYDVIVANNGQDGLQKTIEDVPDIVLSDVMMPEMDGLEMLDKIKNDIRTSHIPVVILTAKADINSRLNGLERGADAYIAKPFIKEELLIQIRSLIELRKKLHIRYASIGHIIMAEDKNYRLEDSFMKRIRDMLIANLGDEMYSIEDICHEIGMSRTQLYRKFRSLTDNTPNDYFRTLRLHVAKELLTGQDITVTDVAYRTGFKNVSYFSRAFHREFGINPSRIHN